MKVFLFVTLEEKITLIDSDFYILLDWDNIGYYNMIERIEAWLFPDEKISSIDVRASPSLDGYHIYIQTFSYINPTLIFRLRFSWHDDPQKLCMDMQNRKARYRGDLFSKKIIIRNGVKHEFKEIKMFKYFRNSSNQQWQLMTLQKQPLTKKLLVD